MAQSILVRRPLGFPWATVDPFLFCVHHDDAYPRGNDRLGPMASLSGRNLGNDFDLRDGFRMYHGTVVPGFPQHPHRGFETVTLVRRGLIDHSDSLGARARFGSGDAQWLTAGGGIVHSEMFPLLEREQPNPVELFQIWLNLPSADKLAPPHFSMLWASDIPERVIRSANGAEARVTVVAGAFDGAVPPPPPPRSWAARAEAEVAIWCLHLAPGAALELPRASSPAVQRTLYFFRGSQITVGGEGVAEPSALLVSATEPLEIRAMDETEILVLQGRPIGEPVVQYGPFVMNTRDEIQQAFQDYQRTRFGGWPWSVDDPVHGREAGRFAEHSDGRVERPAEDPKPSEPR